MEKEQLKQIIEIVNSLIDYSQSAIIRNNFVEGFKNNTINSRLYGTYNTFGAKTFRLTSKQPNMLNSPSTGSIYAKPIKRCFKAEKGKIFCMTDLSSLEDRVMANLSKDKNKLALFTEELDGHCLNSYYYFKEEVEKELPRNENETLFDYIRRYKKATETNPILKTIRQKGKKVTFALSYGAYPSTVAKNLKSSEEYGKIIFDRYHNELYKDITQMRETILNKALKYGNIHLGLGCYIHTNNAHEDIRTLNNAVCQFWSIITLLTIEKMYTLIDENKLTNDIEIVSSIYDSIYFHVTKDPSIIHWLNCTLIPIITKDYLKDIIVHNKAEMEIGYNWADTVSIPNNASILVIKQAIKTLDNIDKQ